MRALQMALVPLTLFAWLVAGLAAPLSAHAAETKMSVKQVPFGKTADGQVVEQYTLVNDHGLTVKIITYGAILSSVQVPDRAGKLGEITLGFDTLDEYLAGHPFFGATCGRVANRIAKGKFSIDGHEFTLATNNGPNHLHGGEKGFDKAVWHAETVGSFSTTDKDEVVGVKLTHRSPDGDEGYPGNLSVTVVYTLSNANTLTIDYTATTDKPTPINLTNHTYWNLADGGKSDVLKHRLTIYADRYLPVDDTRIPTGELKNVHGTPMDFTSSKEIGSRLGQIAADPPGYDHCYVLNQPASVKLKPAARVEEPRTGRVMEVFTTEPALQLYTANFLDGTLKSRGAVFKRHHAFCLEAQHYPDSINQPQFPSTLLKPGQTYRQTTVHKFSTK